jgi:hypothetical protein
LIWRNQGKKDKQEKTAELVEKPKRRRRRKSND